MVHAHAASAHGISGIVIFTLIPFYVKYLNGMAIIFISIIINTVVEQICGNISPPPFFLYSLLPSMSLSFSLPPCFLLCDSQAPFSFLLRPQSFHYLFYLVCFPSLNLSAVYLICGCICFYIFSFYINDGGFCFRRNSLFAPVI